MRRPRSDKNGHADILTLKIGGRSSVDANMGSNGSHNVMIAVAMLVKTCASMRRFRIRREFCKFGVLFACTVASFLGFWSSSRLHFGSPEGSGAPFWEPRGHSLDVLGSVGLILGSLEVC